MVRKKRIEFVVNENGCFIVTSHRLNHDGYADFRHNCRNVRAHRLVYEECFGEIPNGMVVRHKCDTRSCINPEHLEIGTPLDNSRDALNRRRNAFGSRNGRSKITEDDVRKIKLLLREGKMPAAISRELNVSYRACRAIKERNMWKHVSV